VPNNPNCQNQNVNHYENVDGVQLGVPAPLQNEPNVAQIINLQQNRAPVQQYHPPYRNEIYERGGVYDVPRAARGQNFYANVPNGTQRRSNLHLDFRPRCPSGHQHQRSFDDTESCYHGSNNYNMYERIRDEPVYQNSNNNSSNNNNNNNSNSNVYGRLDVIGHGIGRIERHLSSSCGNIDHYNVGGHYAVLSHSHLNPLIINSNQIASGSSQNSREGVKSLFSCLGGENSQSMSSINDNDSSQLQSSSSSSSSTVPRSTGAIPKTKSKSNNKVSPKPSQTVSTTPPIPPPMPKANFSKSSLQYLLMNKWLPLGPDYKIIDFNFMFSRNCSSPGGQCNAAEGFVQFNGQAEMVEPGLYQPPQVREYPMMNNGQYPRVIRNTPQLSRLRESDAENIQYENIQREGYRGGKENAFRARSESPSFNGSRQRQQDDPFRNWSFNFENNSFRPAGQQREVRRITDGTLGQKDFQEQNPKKELPEQVENVSQDQQPTTSKSSSPSSSENSNQSNSTSSSTGTVGKTGEMKKSENYDNLASLQHDPPSASGSVSKQQRKKKSTESQSSDSVTLAEEDEDNEDNDPFDELESDID
jgi:kelch-like protein 2/3